LIKGLNVLVIYFFMVNMGQRDVLEFLEKQYDMNSGKEFKRKEIAKHLKMGPDSLAIVLGKLRKNNEVEYRRGTYLPGGGNPPFIIDTK